MTFVGGTRRRAAGLAAVTVTASLALAACRSSSADTGSTGGVAGGDIAVTVITKTSTNPFFVAMQEGAQKAAHAAGIKLTVAAGKEDGDEATQITAIENAVAAKQKGILITPNGPGVNPALDAARAAGLYVIALDTPPDPADTVDITFATDNFLAGKLIGEWAAVKLGGADATIAMLDLFTDKVVSVDSNRDQGFLTGMGIDVADPKVNGDEAATGSYTGGSGGNYTIVCNAPSSGSADDARTAMENCLQKNPKINVVYTINETAAGGANEALKAAGVLGAIIVSVGGGCDGVRQVKDGVIGATSQQYPLKMAELAVKAIADVANGGAKPTVTDGLDFYSTGVALVTDDPADGVDSIDTTAGADGCWG